jgi:hypothetical protein
MPISDYLPDEFFPKLGKYTAICGHIEAAVWRIVIFYKFGKTENENDLDKILKIRKNTRELRNEADKICDIMPPIIRDDFKSILSRIDDSIENRHIAIHGSWVKDSVGIYKVEFFNRKPKSDEWYCIDRKFTEEGIELAINDADNILTILQRIFDQSQKSERPK